MYSFGADGQLAIKGDVKRISAMDFANRLVGRCWYCTDLNKINADGSVDKSYYYDGAIGSTLPGPFYLDVRELIKYGSTPILPEITWFGRMQIQFNETTGDILTENGDRFLTLVSLSDADVLTTINWANGKDGDIVQGTYHPMTTEAYAQLCASAIDAEAYGTAVKYEFDDAGNVFPVSNPVKHSARDFENLVCGKCWKVRWKSKINEDGTVSIEPYCTDMLGFTDYKYYFEKDSTIRFVETDANPFPVKEVFQTTFDEATGNVIDSNSNRIVTIVHIDLDGELIQVFDGHKYPDHVQLNYCPMTTKEYEQYKQSETPTPSSSPKIVQ